MGFSVTGRVLNSIDGEGVVNAAVSINNQIKGKQTWDDNMLYLYWLRYMLLIFASAFFVFASS